MCQLNDYKTINYLNNQKMKKIYLTVMVAAVALTACDKSETLKDVKGQQQEIAFNPVNMPATKAPIETAAFPDDNIIYVSASNNKTKFFEAKTFKKDGAVWKNYVGAVQTPIYWPLGGAGSFDFLAYSTTLAATAVWGDGNLGTDDDVAGNVTITYPANYALPAAGIMATQDDLLYATTSSSSRNTALPIDFKHALAWVNFMVKSNIPVDIKKIELVNVYTEGKFTIDQTQNTPVTSWDFAGATASDKAILNYVDETTLNTIAGVDIDGTTKLVNTDYAFGDKGILLPAQPIPNFKITYDLGEGDLEYIVNQPRGTWENGKKYTYKIAITFNEITLAPTVTVYDAVTDMPINL